jgi:hypothetical protein
LTVAPCLLKTAPTRGGRGGVIYDGLWVGRDSKIRNVDVSRETASLTIPKQAVVALAMQLA